MEEKIQNCYQLDYPKDKIQLVFITDGSNDKTSEIVKRHENILLLHNANRKGKTAAINRAMSFITSEITVFSDANAMLNEDAIKNIVRHYSNPKVACVSGEKRVSIPEKAAASSAGEGLYWKYESKLKLWDSNLYSATGAAGELFSIRTSLFETVKEEMENLYFFLTVEKIEFNNYWERLDENVESWKELSGFVISRGKTYLRLPNISEFMESEYNNINFTKTLYDIQENVFEFFGLSNTVMGVIMAWGEEDYFD